MIAYHGTKYDVSKKYIPKCIKEAKCLHNMHSCLWLKAKQFSLLKYTHHGSRRATQWYH